MTYKADNHWRGRSYRKGGELIRDLRDKADAKADHNDRDVHTEHCCNKHGCKYGNEDCPVETGKKAQSFPCEYCDSDESYRDYLFGGDEPPVLYAAYRIENHRDRLMTFLGIFTSEARAEETIKAHQATGKSAYFPDGWPRYEYTIQECTLDQGSY